MALEETITLLSDFFRFSDEGDEENARPHNLVQGVQNHIAVLQISTSLITQKRERGSEFLPLLGGKSYFDF